MPLERAEQWIEFRLDNTGAKLKSEAHLDFKKSGNEYRFEGPFVILMRKRGETRPFFVLRIENDELLEPW